MEHSTRINPLHNPRSVPFTSRTQNGLTNNIFLDEITNLLTEVSSRFNNIILLGDLNIYMEDQVNNDAILLSNTFGAFNLTQNIKFSMHNLRHTLGLIATELDNK